MSTHKIIKELLDENLIGAKKEIEDLLYEKLGDHLNEMYTEIAPTLLGEGKKKKKKAKKDYDGDGEVESSEDEWKGSRDKAIKSNMKNEEYDEENEVEEDEEDENEGASSAVGTKTKKAGTSAASTLRPGGAPRDEPGDISKQSRREQISGAVQSQGFNPQTTGTDGY